MNNLYIPSLQSLFRNLQLVTLPPLKFENLKVLTNHVFLGVNPSFVGPEAYTLEDGGGELSGK